MLSLTGARADAQTVKQAPARPIQSMAGVDTYKAYCAVCHGPAGKGNGPAAAALKKAPADLTTIAKRHGGTFSVPDIEAMINGRDVLAHGSRDMPLWGPVFQSIEADDTFAALRLSNLIDYLRSIQTQ
jgi:mono/diheme cytochrome c family protein